MGATEGMASDYGAHSQYQRAVADSGTARIEACVDAVTIGAEASFVIADYGCSTGANSAATRAGAADPRAALDEFFTRLTARFRADPGRDRFDDWTLTVVLSRN